MNFGDIGAVVGTHLEIFAGILGCNSAEAIETEGIFVCGVLFVVAVLTAGYADGIPLAVSNRASVIIRGVKCPILGRVSMDYTIVDVSAVPDAVPGDEAILLGKRGDAEVTVKEWADLKNTHGHDIWCSIGHRVKREYIR